MKTLTGLLLGNALYFTIGDFLPWWIALLFLWAPVFIGSCMDGDKPGTSG
ncbi:MAG TPA: hypothetical protein VIF34_10145 [Methylocystis sp.]|jgi:hypothetical protein